MFEKDLKQYLHFFSSKFFNILKYSSRIYILPCVTIFPTNQCNYNCLMCDYRKSRTRNIEKMDFCLIEKIIAECSEFKIKPLLHFSGQGEPLVYPEIRRMMQACKEGKMKWSMTTNGYFLEQYAEDLVSNNCFAINVSIHGNTLENETITGVASSYDKAVRSIIRLEEIKAQHKKKTPRVAINCVINDYNVTNLWSVLDAFLELPVSSIDFAHLHFSENDIEEQGESPNPAVLRKKNVRELIRFNSYIEETKFPINTVFYPKVRKKDVSGYYTNRSYKFSSRVSESCIFPWLNVSVRPNGSVYCCSQEIGDFRTSSLNEIINSERALEFRERVRKGIGPRPPGCFRCPHKQYY